jgi:hypothetical protein
MTDPPRDEPEKKIFIDEDWKSQVEAEKEELQRRKQQPKEAKGEEEPASAERARAEVPLPPPSLEVLASSLAMQAMMALGLVRDPAVDKVEVHLDQAKHLIDTIAMLQQKTEGNRTPEESSVFDNLLHELRLGFLAVQERLAAQANQADE